MAPDLSVVANVTEAGDIVLLAAVLAATLVVGLILFALDAAVGRFRERSTERRTTGGVEHRPHLDG